MTWFNMNNMTPDPEPQDTLDEHMMDVAPGVKETVTDAISRRPTTVQRSAVPKWSGDVKKPLETTVAESVQLPYRNTDDAVENAIHDILDEFGIDLNDPNFQDTPARVARSMRGELFAGYKTNIKSIMKVFPNEKHEQGLVIESGIPFFSTCAHHMLPFFGKAAIAYIPGSHVLGLSKFGRLIDAYSRRLQLQELITQQVADALEEYLHPKGCMVMLYDTTHLCVCGRGVHAIGATTSTSVVRGLFRDVPALRQEAMSLINQR